MSQSFIGIKPRRVKTQLVLLRYLPTQMGKGHTSSIPGKMLANAMYTAWLTGSAISKYCQLIKVPGIKPKVLTLV